MVSRRETKRMVRDAIFGIACYELDESQTTDREFTYVHKGIVGTKADANRWLKGKQPLKFVEIYPIKEV